MGGNQKMVSGIFTLDDQPIAKGGPQGFFQEAALIAIDHPHLVYVAFKIALL